ncbi:hypothetical protein [Staphylococcus americanisciuri]|uniref:DUF4887 domain-containing protein n=1 Tax=Staphylococcus americanisciuri TaxID=2973940 RepID=A0ABT2F3Q3_9STAP|nr:hypothetical protein [Staphylococcus americanisciuri]MCS4487118.1 hypothetical protein [Staphylococcus americanisciuri]
MQKLINIFVVLLIIIGMVFFGAKAICSERNIPKEAQSKTEIKDEKKKQPSKEKKEQAEPKAENTSVYDTSLSQEAEVPTEQNEIPEAEETVESVQQPDTSYTSPAYTNSQSYIPQQVPTQSPQTNEQNEQLPDTSLNPSIQNDDQSINNTQ